MGKNKTMTVYIPTLFIDISSTPGGVDYEEKDGYTDKKKCEARVKELSKELDEELGIEGFPDDVTDHPEWAAFLEDMLQDRRGHQEDIGKSIKKLSDEEVIKKFKFKETFQEEYEDEDEDEGFDEDNDFRGYGLSGKPHWYTKNVKINL